MNVSRHTIFQYYYYYLFIYPVRTHDIWTLSAIRILVRVRHKLGLQCGSKDLCS